VDSWARKESIMLEKVTSVDLIEVIENGAIQVRTKTAIKEDNVEISSKFHRHVVAPGDDYAGEDARVKAICKATHTADVVAAYRAAQEAARLPQE
jgi:DNA/RNA endonuclease G (NUC1)